MRITRALPQAATSLLLLVIAVAPAAAQYPAPKEGDCIARDFKFHSGEVMSELRLNYRTFGDPSGEPVLILHGTTGSGAGMLSAAFAGELFGPGQPLDAGKYFIILPDAIGHGKSDAPRIGRIRTACARNFHQQRQRLASSVYRSAAERPAAERGCTGVRTAMKLMAGVGAIRMGAYARPAIVGHAVPRVHGRAGADGGAANGDVQPQLDAIRAHDHRWPSATDRDWQDGNYTSQPRAVMAAAVFVWRSPPAAGMAAGLSQKQALDAARYAESCYDARLGAPFKADANDYLYQWEASRDYNAGGRSAERIKADADAYCAINAADDERNPPETGIMERELKSAKLYLIPASEETRGHATTGMAKFWKQQLQELPGIGAAADDVSPRGHAAGGECPCHANKDGAASPQSC